MKKCDRCDNEISPFRMYLSVKGLCICESCAEPEYGVEEEKTCYLCGQDLDSDFSDVVDVLDGDYICSDCAHDNMVEYDPEGDAADDWFNWTRDELR